MTINPPRRVRALIYVANVLGAPFVAYAFAKGWVGELEVSLFSAEVSAAFLLAGLNTGTPPTVQADREALAAAVGKEVGRAINGAAASGRKGR